MSSLVIFMSRIGKKTIEIPENVEVKTDNQKIMVKGPKGELSLEVRPEIKVEIKEKTIRVFPEKDLEEEKEVKAFWGLTRALLANMLKGVVDGYEKKLQIEGLGYKAALEGDNLVLNVGFSHPVKFTAPENIKFSVDKDIITVSGIDKELVGRIAAQIRRIKPPEPYKGKGIRYFDEVVRKKIGKKAVATE